MNIPHIPANRQQNMPPGRRAVLLLSFLLVSLLFHGSCGKKQTTRPKGRYITAYGEGKSAIFFNDTGLASQRAREAALQDAVAQAVGQTLKSRTEVQNMQFISEELSLQTGALVRKYTIEKEERVDAGQAYLVRVKASIYRTKIEDSFQEVLQRLGNPRMMFLLRETIHLKDRRYRIRKEVHEPGQTFAEIAIGNVLTRRGVKFIDQKTTRSLAAKNSRAIRKALGGNAAEALALTRSLADVVIIGEAETRDAGDLAAMGISGGKGMYSSQATLRLKILEANGEVILQHNCQTAAVHVNRATAAQRALDKVGRKAIEEITPQLRKYFLAKPQSNEITMNLAGIQAGSEELLAFKSLLLSTTRARRINTARSRGKLVVWRVTYPGTSERLSEEISLKQKAMGFSLTLLEQNLSTLNYRISRRR
jgi:hypothetical protein